MTLRSMGVGLLESSRVFVLLVLLVMLQVTVMPEVRVLGGSPDLVLVLTVLVALFRGPLAGTAVGFIGGLGVDALGLGIVGLTSLVLVLVGFAAGVVGERLRRRATLRPLLVVAVASILSSVVEIGLTTLIGTPSTVSRLILIAAIPSAMLDVLASIAMRPLVRRMLPDRSRAVRSPIVDEPVVGVVA